MNMKCTELDYLFDAIKTLDEKDEFYNFFQDLCTIDELHEMGQRFEVARLLDRGENYDSIRKSTGVSAGTISRIKRAYQPINMAPVDTSSQSSVSISFMALFIKTRMIRKLKYRNFLRNVPVF